MHPAALYSSYGAYLKKRFGGKVHKLSVDAGFNCPNRDGSSGYGGCAWCDNSSFTPRNLLKQANIIQQLEHGISILGPRMNVCGFIAYFQPFTNTYADADTLMKLYTDALSVEGVVGLSIGTRPDCIDSQKISVIEELAKKNYVQIEYGLQSADDNILSRMNRGHTVEDFTRAMEISIGRGIEICGHMIAGLPGESAEGIIKTALLMRDSGITGIKIHNLHIVENTILAQQYRAEPFPLLSMHEYAGIVVDILEQLPWDITVQRLWGAPSRKDLLVAPAWCFDGAGVRRSIENEFLHRGSRQGSALS